VSPQRREAVGRYVLPVAEALMKEMERSTALDQHGIAGLRDVLLAALPEPDVKQQAAIVLARRDEPLLAREVQQRLLGRFPADRVPALTELAPPSATVPNSCNPSATTGSSAARPDRGGALPIQPCTWPSFHYTVRYRQEINRAESL
jgi:hypothetical protein